MLLIYFAEIYPPSISSWISLARFVAVAFELQELITLPPFIFLAAQTCPFPMISTFLVICFSVVFILCVVFVCLVRRVCRFDITENAETNS